MTDDWAPYTIDLLSAEELDLYLEERAARRRGTEEPPRQGPSD